MTDLPPRTTQEQIAAQQQEHKKMDASIERLEALKMELGMTDLRKQAMALYTPPFRCESGVLLDISGNMVNEAIGAHLLHYLRKGWIKNDSQRPHSVLAGEFGAIVAQALNEFYAKNEKESLTHDLASHLNWLISESAPKGVNPTKYNECLDRYEQVFGDEFYEKHGDKA